MGVTLGSDIAIGDDGTVLDLSSNPPTVAWSTNETVSSLTYTDGTNTWVQTLSYDSSGRYTGATAWVKQ